MDTSTSIGRFTNYKNSNGITRLNSLMLNLFFLPSFVSSKEPHPSAIVVSVGGLWEGDRSKAVGSIFGCGVGGVRSVVGDRFSGEWAIGLLQ